MLKTYTRTDRWISEPWHFKNPKQVKRINVTKKENAIINKLNKTKTEITTEKFIENQEMLMRDILKERKQYERDMEEQRKQYEAQKEKNSDPYADLYNENNLQTNEFRNENWVEDDFMWVRRGLVVTSGNHMWWVTIICDELQS